MEIIEALLIRMPRSFSPENPPIEEPEERVLARGLCRDHGWSFEGDRVLEKRKDPM
jgi:hypothetical protein